MTGRTTQSQSFAVVILAGGSGNRMGGGKAQRLLGGQTLLARAVHKARTWSPHIALALRKNSQMASVADIERINDIPGIAGPIAGLAAALAFAERKGCVAVLTMPCDMPFLPDDLAERLTDASENAGATLASCNDRLQPMCALWPVSAHDDLQAYLDSEDRSLTGFAKSLGYVAISWPSECADRFFNINTPKDLEIAEKMHRLLRKSVCLPEKS